WNINLNGFVEKHIDILKYPSCGNTLGTNVNMRKTQERELNVQTENGCTCLNSVEALIDDGFQAQRNKEGEVVPIEVGDKDNFNELCHDDGQFKTFVQHVELTTRKGIELKSMKKFNIVDENIDISIVREKEKVPMEVVEMDEDHGVDHSKIKEALQLSLATDPFIVFIEPKD
ncbi:hypothetical protein Tco_0500357, partial [Tanacetum coccineum]